MKKKPFVLVLEGPDMCGKSQIVAALSHALGVPSFKASSEHETFLSKQDLFLHQIRHAAPREVDLIAQGCIPAIIMDRAWPSEYVYSRFYGRETDINVLRYVDSMMASFDAKIVVCHRSSYDNVVDDIQPLLRGQKLSYIEQGYREFERWTRCKIQWLNVDDEDLVRECAEILSFLGYIGAPLAHVMDEVREHDSRVKSGAAACCA